MVKLGEASSHLALMHRKVEAVFQGEAQAILKANAKIAKLEKIFYDEVMDLMAEANNRIQWF